MLWSLVVDSLLSELNVAGLYTQTYADDPVILCPSRDIRDLQGPTIRVLRIAERRSYGERLGIYPDKTEVILFTKKRKLRRLPTIKLVGRTLQFKGTVKYLGVILDSRLSWNDHIEARTKKAI